jgi:HEPN domain-containing protein
VSFRPDQRWLSIARRDLDAARTLATAPRPVPEVAAYQCQQAAEKLVKAMLIRRGVQPPRSHDVGRLLDMLADAGGDVSALHGFARLTEFAVLHRYPSDSPDEPPPPSPAEVLDWVGRIEAVLDDVASPAPEGSP